INASNLFDVPFKGLNYTWDSNRAGDSNIRERIDRVLVNDAFLEASPHQTLTHHLLIGSDHAPLLYNTCPPPRRQQKSFRFESMWTTDESCEEAIKGAWCPTNLPNDIENLKHNMSSCAKSLVTWSRKHFGNNKKNIKKFTLELNHLQSLPYTNENGS
ncbi:reverse transcriptase, partial [Tanacetum coccineum]